MADPAFNVEIDTAVLAGVKEALVEYREGEAQRFAQAIEAWSKGPGFIAALDRHRRFRG